MQNQTNDRVVYNLNTLGYKRCKQFGHYKYTKVKPRLENHIHKDIIEICYCLKGQQFYNIEQNELKLNGNDILIVSPNTIHSTGVYPEDKGELFWIQISLNNDLGKLCNLPFLQSNYILKALTKKSNAVFKGAFSLKNILNALFTQLEKPQSILSVITINHLIIQLLLETLSLTEKPQEVKPTIRLNIINEYIEKNLSRSIYVDELAGAIKISVSYFKTWFKENTGITPNEYINRLKIKQAKVDLLNEKTITQVAFNLGYNSSQYFATSFKKFTGITPKAYIAKHNTK
ncbi:AraC family transcriptional regulator [Jejuia spongiicola]|uniref:AraC family transcriptional regulator n=1 Tax=Jejuia spongiicola TaxID=2942207 RepID=A0ABT0QCS9_9FLAO|nr:AraC family transcriptional regulator [Jejuia spongiicola]